VTTDNQTTLTGVRLLVWGQ